MVFEATPMASQISLLPRASLQVPCEKDTGLCVFAEVLSGSGSKGRWITNSLPSPIPSLLALMRPPCMLHEGVLARYGLRPSEFLRWRELQQRRHV
jgi:hypothetical protein